MFVFNRSAAAVLLPLALLVAVVLWSNWSDIAAPRTPAVAAGEHAPEDSGHQAGRLTASNNRAAGR